MQLVVFWLVYPFLWCISILPFRMLYLISDFVYFFVYRVFGYRKMAVRRNLEIALPHLNVAERRRIEQKFYVHMCDIFLEMIKTMTMSVREMDRRYVFVNKEQLTAYDKSGKGLIMMCAHYASWEWLIAISNHTEMETVAVYKKVANKYFDKLVRDIRERLNSRMIESKFAIDAIIQDKEKGVQAVYGFLSDQSPQLTKARHWEEFLGVEVPIHTGAEMLARKLDLNVAYCKVIKKKRGFYEATIIPITDNAPAMPENLITSLYLREVEKQIYETPEYYFWTHKRWKHAGKKSEAPLTKTTA